MLATNLDIIRQLPGYVTCKNKELIITHANEQMAKAVGCSSVAQNIGLTDYELPCPACELAEEFRSQDRQVIQSKKPIEIIEIVTYADYKPRLIFTKKSPLYDEAGKISGVSCIGHEITNNALTDLYINFLHADHKKFSNSNKSYTLASTHEKFDLTERESECLFHLLRGKTAKEIAHVLCLSNRTIETHLKNIKIKMNCDKKSQLIEVALANGMLFYIPKKCRGILTAVG